MWSFLQKNGEASIEFIWEKAALSFSVSSPTENLALGSKLRNAIQAVNFTTSLKDFYFFCQNGLFVWAVLPLKEECAGVKIVSSSLDVPFPS